MGQSFSENSKEKKSFSADQSYKGILNIYCPDFSSIYAFRVNRNLKVSDIKKLLPFGDTELKLGDQVLNSETTISERGLNRKTLIKALCKERPITSYSPSPIFSEKSNISLRTKTKRNKSKFNLKDYSVPDVQIKKLKEVDFRSSLH
jgi:hypothetical protein